MPNFKKGAEHTCGSVTDKVQYFLELFKLIPKTIIVIRFRSRFTSIIRGMVIISMIVVGKISEEGERFFLLRKKGDVQDKRDEGYNSIF